MPYVTYLHMYICMHVLWMERVVNIRGEKINLKGISYVYYLSTRIFYSFVFKVLSFSRRKYLLPADFADDYHLEILKEALLRAIQDIDKTFSKVGCI